MRAPSPKEKKNPICMLPPAPSQCFSFLESQLRFSFCFRLSGVSLPFGACSPPMSNSSKLFLLVLTTRLFVCSAMRVDCLTFKGFVAISGKCATNVFLCFSQEITICSEDVMCLCHSFLFSSII